MYSLKTYIIRKVFYRKRILSEPHFVGIIICFKMIEMLLPITRCQFKNISDKNNCTYSYGELNIVL